MRIRTTRCRFPVLSLAVLALSLPAAGYGATEWRTYRDAVSAFENGDASIRAEAFAWMRAGLGGFATKDISQGFQAFRTMADALGKEVDTTAIYQEIAPSHADDWRASLAAAIADDFARRGDQEKADAFLRAFLGENPDIAAELRADLVVRCANWLAGPLGKPRDADGFLASERASLPEDAAMAAARLDSARAAILADFLNQRDQAEALWRGVLALGSVVHERDVSFAADRLAALLQDKGDKEGAATTLLGLLGHPSSPPTWLADRLIAIGSVPEVLEKAVDALRGRMAQVPASETSYRSAAERIQPQTAALLLALGRSDEALAECRVAMQLASDRGYESAVISAAGAFKRADANLGRVNALLAFAAVSNAEPPPPNPMLGVPPASDSARAAFAAKLAALPDSPDWRDHLSRSLSWLWLDRPADAMRTAVHAFSLCPLETNALQQCAAAVTRPFLVATRDEAAVQPLLDFLLLGPDGPDGKPGTDDDLPDPLPALTVRIEPRARANETP